MKYSIAIVKITDKSSNKFHNYNTKEGNRIINILTFYRKTCDKWIACLPIWATANWIVIDNIAFAMRPTCTGARINTLLSDTCLIHGTFRTYNTFWTTIWRRTNISGSTWTNWMIRVHTARRIRSTRRWYAKILNRPRWIESYFQIIFLINSYYKC